MKTIYTGNCIPPATYLTIDWRKLLKLKIMDKLNEQKSYEGHGEKVLDLIINNKEYKWEKEYITGAEIKKLGMIPDIDKLFLAIKKPWEDEEIGDDKQVNLARPEIEHFFSKKQIGRAHV